MRSVVVIVIIWCVLFAWYQGYRYLYPVTTERTTHIRHIPFINSVDMSSIGQEDGWDEASYTYEIIAIASWLEVPRAVVETAPWRLLVTERAGRVRQIVDGVLVDEPVLVIPQISNRSEEWLMSLITDPQYDENAWVYLAYAQSIVGGMEVHVVRYTDVWDALTDPVVVIGWLPAAQRHAWTALAFGPDGYLYITVGDATQKHLAQSLDTYHGKILRIGAQGDIPEDNPFPHSAIWSIWHRNVQGIWRTHDAEMYASEHGPSTFDGPPWGDEINRIIPWANYGRPLVSHEQRASGMQDPIAVYTPAIAPASLLVYSWSLFPKRQNHLFVGMLRGEWILQLQIDPEDPDRIIHTQKIVDDTYGRIRFVGQWLDWSIYFTTSNEDGRGRRRPEGDGVYQIRRQSYEGN